jgi:RimJ/RimL family protein N-acetyltransferase
MLRAATGSDISFVHGLYMHPQANPYLLYEIMDVQAFLPIYADLLEKKIKYVFEHEGVAVGMCKLVPYTHRSSHIVYLGGLAVDPDHSGRGLGIALLNDIINWSRSRGFRRIELSVALQNEKAIRLYQRCGFQKEGIMKKYTYLAAENRYLDEVLMSLIL